MWPLCRHTDDISRTVHNTLVDKLVDEIMHTRADIKKLVNGNRESQRIKSTESTPEPTSMAPAIDIPLVPQQENFCNIKHWGPELYHAIRHQRGDIPAEGDRTSYQFMEDTSGNVVPAYTRRQVSRDVKYFFQKMHTPTRLLAPLRRLDWDIHSDFHTYIEEKYPWLRLCDNHWKADLLWTINWTGWKPETGVAQDGAQLGAIKREHSTNTDNNQAGPSSKQPKTTAPKISPRPKPTNKVGNSSHNVYVITECILDESIVSNSRISCSVDRTNTPFPPASLLRLTRPHTSSWQRRYVH